jgi:hypothetical protein
MTTAHDSMVDDACWADGHDRRTAERPKRFSG